MARFARVIVPGLPHHVTWRGNRSELIFLEDAVSLTAVERMRFIPSRWLQLFARHCRTLAPKRTRAEP